MTSKWPLTEKRKCLQTLGKAVFLLLLVYPLPDTSLYAAELTLTQEDFVYTPDDMLGFNIHQYLNENAPHLIDQADAIAHWSGYSSVSPKILIALIQFQQQENQVAKTSPDLPGVLSTFSKKTDTAEQIEDIAMQLSNRFYTHLEQGANNPQIRAIETLLNGERKQQTQDTKPSTRLSRFVQTFQRLFPDKGVAEQMSPPLNAAPKTQSQVLLTNKNSGIQLPFPVGDTWQTWGGTHTFTGNGSGPRSSLDFRRGRQGWGDNTSAIWVASATSGTAIRHSSCFAEVIGPGGWSTTYYHLDNIQVNTGQHIAQNTRIANYADNHAQSICGGGHSSGPHLHFSLKRNGIYVSLDSVGLSGYIVHDGRSNYDSDCRYFWLDNNGVKVCAGDPILNNGVASNPEPAPDLTPVSISISRPSLYSGQVFSITTRVENQGDQISSSTPLQVLRSDDRGISSNDTVSSTLVLASLASRGSVIRTAMVTAPATAGQYWLGVCVTPTPTEVVRSNNCSIGVPFTVEERQNGFLPSIFLLLSDESSKKKTSNLHSR